MFFSRKTLKYYAEVRTREPARERQSRSMRKTGFPDALPAAIAIAHAARRRRCRRERLCGLAPVVALAIGIAICVATMAVLGASWDAIPLMCSAFGDCPQPF
jgi:hypothetical protein